MKIQYLVAPVLAAVVTSPLAYSAPGGMAQVMHFQRKSDYAFGSFSDSNVYQYFSAQVYDDMNGPMGAVSTEEYDYNTDQYMYIACSGPTYAEVLSVSPPNTQISINATLDPTSTDCISYNVSTPVTLDLAGQFDGNDHYSQNGTGKETYYGVDYKYNFQSDYFSETFTGTNGFGSDSDNFTGYVEMQHYINREKVK